MFSISDGSILSSRYKSTTGVSSVSGSAINGDYFIISAYSYLLMLNFQTMTFTSKSFSGILFGVDIDQATGR